MWYIIMAIIYYLLAWLIVNNMEVLTIQEEPAHVGYHIKYVWVKYPLPVWHGICILVIGAIPILNVVVLCVLGTFLIINTHLSDEVTEGELRLKISNQLKDFLNKPLLED